MSVLSPLKTRPMRWLWSGQLFSCVGDEIYNVALIWLAAGIVGTNAGYVGAMESGALLIGSLFISHIADLWDERRTMIWVDIIRGVLVLLPPILLATFGLSMWTLLPIAFFVAGLESFFRPAMFSVLPRLASSDRNSLHQTNALMSTTERLARVIGPIIVAFLSQILPIVHFFTVNALTFFASSLSIYFIKDERLKSQHSRKVGSLTKSWKQIKAHDNVFFYFITAGPSAAVWYMAYPLGLGLMMKLELGLDISSFGKLLACYGIGNFLGAVLLGSFSFGRPEVALSIGRTMAGVGFLIVGFAPLMEIKMLGTIIASLGGPISDVPYQTMVQKTFPPHQQAGVFRLHMGHSRIWITTIFLVSPLAYQMFQPSEVIAICGVVLLTLGGAGAWQFRNLDPYL